MAYTTPVVALSSVATAVSIVSLHKVVTFHRYAFGRCIG